MGSKDHCSISRRNFLKWSGTATAAIATAAHAPVLRALVPSQTPPREDEARYVYSICDMCLNKCGLRARVEKGVVTKLDPNPYFIKSHGMLCAKGNAGIMQLYDRDRLKYPLLRKGKRGEGKWQRLTWDQALDLAAEQLKKIGDKYTRCGMLFLAGEDAQSRFVDRFAEVYGSYNIISHESNCYLSRNRAFIDTYGEVPIPDVLKCKYLIMAGANRFEALVTPDTMDLVAAMKNGSKLIVLDPRFTKTAGMAHEWYPIKPGTDMAFFLAVAHVLIREGLYDKEFIEKKTSGFKHLAAHVRKYTPEWAEKQCEIPAKDIRRIAREAAAAAPAAMVYPGRRSSDYENSTQIRRAFAIVNVLLGNWDRPGGLLPPTSVKLGSISYDAPFYENNPDDRVDMERSLMMFDEAGSFKHARDAVIEGKPYPVKGWFIYKSNPMQTGANRRKTLKMIHKLDFMIDVDVTMSDTAWMADLVLPAPSYLERMDPVSGAHSSCSCNCLVTRDPVVPPLYESKSVFWIVKELANRLDLGEFFDFTMEEFRKAQLKAFPDAEKTMKEKGGYNVKTEAYGAYEGKDFKTPSKKIELYPSRYVDAGIDPLPVYTPPKRVPRGKFRLVVGRNAYTTHGSSQNNTLLHELLPVNHLWINAKSAAGLGIKTGDWVRVASRVGSGRIPVKITEGIREDTVYMESGFGPLSKGLRNIYGVGLCIAEILEDYNDEITGNMAMHETMVTVRKG